MANVAKYGKPEEMEKRIDEYFAQFENPEPLHDKNGLVVLDKQGKPVYRDEMPTSAGLAYFWGSKVVALCGSMSRSQRLRGW